MSVFKKFYWSRHTRITLSHHVMSFLDSFIYNTFENFTYILTKEHNLYQKYIWKPACFLWFVDFNCLCLACNDSHRMDNKACCFLLSICHMLLKAWNVRLHRQNDFKLKGDNFIKHSLRLKWSSTWTCRTWLFSIILITWFTGKKSFFTVQEFSFLLLA